MLKTDFLVVGGGIAGVTCAEHLAFTNPDCQIILLSKSRVIKAVTNLVPVSKMLTNFNVIDQEASTLTKMYPNIKIVFECLTQLNSVSQIAETPQQKIHYEYICLCMGGQPKLIKNETEFRDYIIGIRDTDSVQVLQDKLKYCSNVLIVGNGGIASELVNELKNVEIIWAVKDSHISATFLDPGAAEFFKQNVQDGSGERKGIIKRIRYLEHGSVSGVELGCAAALGPDWHTHFEISGKSERKVQIEYNCEVVKIEKGNPILVTLSNGKEIQCDLIISATGVTPTQVTTDKPLKIAPDLGISVNEKLQTSLPKVYAAGDICTADWTPAKHWFQMRLWSQARHMGAYAAKSMIAALNHEHVMQDFCFEMFAHATTLFNYKVALLGLYNAQTLGGGYEVLLRVTPSLEYIKLVNVDGRVQGAILIGETGLEETIENLILNQLDISSYGDDLLNPDIDIEDYFD